MTTFCAVEGCTRPLDRYRTYCRLHYTRVQRNGEPGPPTPIADRHTPDHEKFWARVDVAGVCWEWTGGTNERGYGYFSPGTGRFSYAHRWAWQYLIGPIPEDMTLDHLCTNKRCVNPDHLEVVTRAENSRRANPLRSAA